MENEIILMEENGNKIKAEILFTHNDINFNKDYVVYKVDGDILASSYKLSDSKFIIDSDLTSEEYDMIDELLKVKLGDDYE